LVVDNNSTDDTGAVLAKYVDKLPLRNLFESKQGHSHARNCAIEASRGELLLWTDDDVLVDENWLAAHVAAADKWPEAAYFRGRILPWFEVEPPRWMKRRLQELVGVLALADGDPFDREATAKELPVGANMGIRTKHLREMRFDPALGRVGEELTSGDDKDICARLRAAGHGGVWVGTAVVKHFVPSDRCGRDYVWRWFSGAGQTHARSGRYGCTDEGVMSGWVRRKYVLARIVELLLRPLKNDAWFDALRSGAILHGALREGRIRRAGRRRLSTTAAEGKLSTAAST
jgi:glycosyltransferase involved in cell wall biosynthesis